MRLKAVPTEIAAAATKSPLLLIGGAAVVALVGWQYFSKHSNAASSAPATSTAPYSIGGIGPSNASGADTIGSILGGGGGGGGGGSAGADNSATAPAASTPATSAPATSAPVTSNPVAVPTGNVVNVIDPAGLPQTTPFPNVGGIDPATAELLSQQRLKLGLDYSYEMAQLALTGHIVDVNASLQVANLNSLDYQAAANLASSFMLSNNQLMTTTITGPDGRPILDFSGLQARDSKGNSWDQNLQGFLNRGSLDQYYQETGHPYNTAPLPSAGYGTPPGNVNRPTLPTPFDINNYYNPNGVVTSIIGGGQPPAPVAPSLPQSSTVSLTQPAPAPANTNTSVSVPSLTSVPSAPPTMQPAPQPTVSQIISGPNPNYDKQVGGYGGIGGSRSQAA